MSIHAETSHEAPGFQPVSRIRNFFRSALGAFAVQAEDSYVLALPRNRHEALIHAARTAFGGTLDWV